jgi:hypothetical protein
MAQVFEVWDATLGRKVTMKVSSVRLGNCPLRNLSLT